MADFLALTAVAFFLGSAVSFLGPATGVLVVVACFLVAVASLVSLGAEADFLGPATDVLVAVACFLVAVAGLVSLGAEADFLGPATGFLVAVANFVVSLGAEAGFLVPVATSSGLAPTLPDLVASLVVGATVTLPGPAALGLNAFYSVAEVLMIS